MAPFFPPSSPPLSGLPHVTWTCGVEGVYRPLVVQKKRAQRKELESRLQIFSFYPLSPPLPVLFFPEKDLLALSRHIESSMEWGGQLQGCRITLSSICEKKRRNFAGELEREEAVDNSCYRKSLRAMLEVIGLSSFV